ncbi:MAG TPA: ATP-binding protein [Candidatus Saccharimonadales bacterium]|nr:ATP-binding protein [Candidatus Saccharimonadales bacterium]
MAKIELSKPALICLYGFPGSGKSYLARNLAKDFHMANVSSDRIRGELFQNPRYDAQENAIITHLMDYICEEFLDAGVSVIYDTNALRSAQRRKLREMARRQKAQYLLIWLQIDMDTAFSRTQGRDRRTTDDRFAEPQTKATFDRQLSGMQNPEGEDYLVVSGKHTFATQKSAIVNRLYQLGLVGGGIVQHNVAKPELINLVPNPHAGRVDLSRRNINIV